MKNQTRKFKYVVYACSIASVLFHISFLPIKFDLKQVLVKEEATKKVRIRLQAKDRNNIRQMAESLKSESKIEREAEFFSDSNNSFTKQTKARNTGPTNNAGLGDSQKNIKQTKAVVENTNEKNVKKKESKNGAKISFEDFSFSENTKPEKERKKQVKGTRNGDVKNQGLAQTSDYLEDIPLGDMTNLNTKEHVYYGFYYRIKLKLEQHWGSTLKEKMEALYKKNGRFPASDKYITNIKVTLDSRGTIKNIKLEGSSGVDELDSAAIESFNRAGPFPNPPKGMVINNEAHVEWGFAVTNS